jgi:membrane protease YdiL (CAAX protease family)
MPRDDRAADPQVELAGDRAGARSGGGQVVRWAIAAATVAVWITLGFAFRLNPNVYLLLSIPFVAGFQIVIARRPLRAVWLREAPRFTVDLRTIVVFVLVAIVPVYAAVTAARGADWVGFVYGLAATGGAAGVAYAVGAVRGLTVRQLVVCVVIVCAISTVLDIVNGLATGNLHPASFGSSLVTGGYWFLLYLPAVFVVEEVFFRGVLDAYVHRGDNGTGWLSATWVSALWGLWHLPIYFVAGGSSSVLGVVIGLLVVQIAIGIPLSIGWRRSGNLLVPGTAHALSDAIRNVLIGLP